MRNDPHYDIRVPYLPRDWRWTVRECNRQMHYEGVCGRPPQDVHVVYGDSLLEKRKVVWELAKLFRREFGYDFVQYDPKQCDPDARAFIWGGGHQPTAIGACCFRLRVEDGATWWALQWIWFHPYERRGGHLSRAWDYFRRRFGFFHVETPLSPAMEQFLATRGGDPYLNAVAGARVEPVDLGGLLFKNRLEVVPTGGGEGSTPGLLAQG